MVGQVRNTHAAGGSVAQDERMLAIHAMREAGMTLEQIGAVFGVTRERVRQVLAADGGISAARVREIRARRKQAQVVADAAVLVSWLKSNPGRNMRQVTEALGWTESRAALAMTREARHLMVSERDGEAYRIFSDKQILAALRKAWGLRKGEARGLSHQQYQKLVREGLVHGPSAPRVIQIFGTWSRALDLAGVPSGKRPGRDYERKWTDGEILAHVVRYIDAERDAATFAGWDVWRRENAPDAPSGGMVRMRLGKWSDVKRLALAAAAARRQTTSSS